jgi:hypothetical protein
MPPGVHARPEPRSAEVVARRATPRPAPFRPSAPFTSRGAASSLLGLQRAAGNAAVAQAVVQPDLLDDAKSAASGIGKAIGGAIDSAEAAAKGALAELEKLGTCGPKLAKLASGVSEAIQDLLLRHVRDHTVPTMAEAQALLPLVEKSIIDGVCDCLTDELVTAVALHVYLVGQPNAQKHLQHYLTGGGAPFVEDIADLFAKNPTIRTNVGAQVGEASNGGAVRRGTLAGGADLPGGGQAPGFPPITQLDYDDQDWRNSIGNVDQLDFVIVSGPDAAGNAQVQITLSDIYAWHGKEPRLSQCVHQAIENMKRHGAAEYKSTGTAVVSLNLGATFVPKDPVGPR